MRPFAKPYTTFTFAHSFVRAVCVTTHTNTRSSPLPPPQGGFRRIFRGPLERSGPSAKFLPLSKPRRRTYGYTVSRDYGVRGSKASDCRRPIGGRPHRGDHRH